MKRLAAIFLCLVLLCSCSSVKEQPVQSSGPLGTYIKDSPSAGNYFTYTPIIDIFSPEIGEDASFLDFDGRNFYMDSAFDKSIVFSYNIESRQKENLTNAIGFHSENFLSDGENCYYIKNDENNEPWLLCRNISSGEEKSLVLLQKEEYEYEESANPSEAKYSLYKSGGFIIAVKSFENGGITAFFYNPESGETGYSKTSALSGHESIPVNGYFTYVEKTEKGFSLFAVSPRKGKSSVRGPVSDNEIISSAYDGKTFVWATDEGIFCKSGKNIVHITDEARSFAFLGRNFVLWKTKSGTVGLYRIDSAYTGGFNKLPVSELVYADENSAVFRTEGGAFGEEYISVQIKVGEEPLYLKDAADRAPYTIAVDGYLYYCFMEPSGITPTEKQISGKITSAWDDGSTVPRRNNQANGSWLLGRQYAFADGELLLSNETGKAWYICKKSYTLSEMKFD